MRSLSLLLSLGSLLLALPAAGQPLAAHLLRQPGSRTVSPHPPTDAEITARIDAMAERSDLPAAANRALGQARLASNRARERATRGESESAGRARQIAWSALILASRQIALARGRAALHLAERRAASAEARAARAREALERALEQRARLLTEPPAAPTTALEATP